MANIFKKKTIVTDKVTGKKVEKESKKWYARYCDVLGIERYKPLSTDYQIAQKMFNQILERLELEKAGILDPTEAEMKKPILEHLDGYEKHLKAKNNSPRHVVDTIRRIKRLIADRRILTLLDFKAAAVEEFLTYLRDEEQLSLQTCNHHLRSFKAFSRWMVNNERLNRDPLTVLTLFNVRTDRRHDRRPLSMDEFTLMHHAAKTGPPVEGLNGMDRAMLYLLAAWTGFRKGELGSLTLRSFNLKMNNPTVTIEAAYSKHRREDVQILHPDIVERFNEWLGVRCPESEDEILFPISLASCGIERNTSGMMEFDLTSARNFWIAKAENEEDKKLRETSDCLKYRDSQGKFADFHALRHTFITNLSLANVSPKTAQALARHSDIKLTMNIYSHINPDEQAKAINSLPGLPSKNGEVT
jgi:integrase